MMSFSQGAPLTPAGGSFCSLHACAETDETCSRDVRPVFVSIAQATRNRRHVAYRLKSRMRRRRAGVVILVLAAGAAASTSTRFARARSSVGHAALQTKHRARGGGWGMRSCVDHVPPPAPTPLSTSAQSTWQQSERAGERGDREREREGRAGGIRGFVLGRLAQHANTAHTQVALRRRARRRSERGRRERWRDGGGSGGGKEGRREGVGREERRRTCTFGRYCATFSMLRRVKALTTTSEPLTA